MPETDVLLGEDDVEVRAADFHVFNADGNSTIHADEVKPLRGVFMESDDGDRSVEFDAGSLLWQNEAGRSLTMSPEGINFPQGTDDEPTTVYADVASLGDSVRADAAEATTGHFVDGTFGGNAWGTEEPVAGTVEVLNEHGAQSILLDGSSGVVSSTGGDVAEYFPNGTDRTFDAGEVVGLEDGGVVALGDGVAADAVANRDEAFVVAESPMLLGNRPPGSGPDPDRADHVPVALLGRVPVRVAADVAAGDRLVATADGRAVPAGGGTDDAPTVGRALESATEADGTATALVGRSPAARDDRIDELRAETERLRADNETLEAENEALRERLAAVEERLTAVEEGLAATEGAAGTGATADD